MAGGLLLVGCGKMGGALLDGWLDKGVPAEEITVVEPFEAASHPVNRADVIFTADVLSLSPGITPEVIIFAVKPQSMDGVVLPYAEMADRGSIILSIAAGRPIAFFEQHLGVGAAVIRAMPNTPAAVQRGITVLCANSNVSEAGRAQCEGLLAAVGEVGWIEDESLMDAVTAVSGSGPAYVFLLAECLAEAGEAAGLPTALADQLARVTISGSGELLRLSDNSSAQLRRNVTSPGGTTEAALKVLMADVGLAPLMKTAIEAAKRRSQELAS